MQTPTVKIMKLISFDVAALSTKFLSLLIYYGFSIVKHNILCMAN